jgi:hypothetical protein
MLGPPVVRALGIPLPDEALAAVVGFVERHRAALLEHWGGMTSSLDLLRALDGGAGRRP